MSSISGLVDKAVKNDMPAIALTDHGNMFGTKELFNYVKKINKEREIPFKPIFGVEAYMARRSMMYNKTNKERKPEDKGGWHLILLAKNKQGYQNLCKLVSASWIDGFYAKPRIDKDLLEKYHEGLIVSSACLGGEIPTKLMGSKAKDVDDDTLVESEYDSFQISAENMRNAEESVMWFKNLFGDDYYLEIQRHKTNKEGANTDVFIRQQVVNKAILELAEKTNTKVIATNDVHFVEEEHGEAHDRLICLSTRRDFDDPKRMRYTKQEWLKTPKEMEQIFADCPQTLQNTLEIAEKVEFYSIDSDAMMPIFDIPKEFGSEEEYRKKFTDEELRKEFGDERFEKLGGYNKVLRVKFEADYLTKLTYEGAKHRYGETLTSEIRERIDFELNTMKTMGFPGYFLIVQDFIAAARRMSVSVGPGRGSAAGSVVAYCLKITDVDPLEYDLLFERFLNPDRISMPDIDIDFDDEGRGKVLQWVTEKYGKERVAHIITYGTMAAKSSIKDVARVQKLPLSESNRLTKLIPAKFDEDPKTGKTPKVTLSNIYKMVPEMRKEVNSFDKNITSVLKYAEMLEGTVRQIGIHACGVIIGAEDLTNFVPISTIEDRASGEELLVTQYEGSVIEEVGLIKMDFLGLKTLSIIKEALSIIKKTKGINLDIDKIPIDDAKTYELYANAETTGTFQFESTGMQKYLRELKPTKFEDLIAMNALYRPGPMQYIPSFIARKHGREKITYDFPEMENRLKETYGITVYQEQVMLLSRDLAGFTRGQSDLLRKAMGKKLIDKMEILKVKFLEGATANGFAPMEKLEKIWNDWSEFAKYAFNKSHATCYSWIAYQTAYLKANFPAEFMAANLTLNKDNNTDVEKFMEECKAMEIKVLLPDINESEKNFTVNKKGEIRFGLGGIKNVGEAAVESIIEERNSNGAFKNIFDFLERANLRACNKKTIESLVYSGAFDSFKEIEREDYFATETTIDELIMYGKNVQASNGETSLFSEDENAAIPHPKIIKSPKWNDLVKLNFEKELIGTYVSGHPLDKYKSQILYGCSHTLVELNDAVNNIKNAFDSIADNDNNNFIKENQVIFTVGGIITNTLIKQSAKGNNYGVFTLTDYSGTMEFRLIDGWQPNDKYYTRFGNLLEKDSFIVIRGYIRPNMQKDKINPTLFIKRINIDVVNVGRLNEIGDKLLKNINIEIKLHKITKVFLNSIATLINSNQGNIKLNFEIKDAENHLLSLQKSDKGIEITKTFLDELEEMAKNDTIIFSINNKKFEIKKAETEEIEEFKEEEMID
jgi:DNA polymerase-3 subunit alpha